MAPERLVEAAFLCDNAHEYEGKVSVLGAFANVGIAPSLPAMHATTLVVRFGWITQDDHGFEIDLKVIAYDPDRQPLAEVGGRAALARITSDVREMADLSGLPAGSNLILPLVIPIAKLGVHQVEVRVDDDLATSLPLLVVAPGP